MGHKTDGRGSHLKRHTAEGLLGRDGTRDVRLEAFKNKKHRRGKSSNRDTHTPCAAQVESSCVAGVNSLRQKTLVPPPDKGFNARDKWIAKDTNMYR